MLHHVLQDIPGIFHSTCSIVNKELLFLVFHLTIVAFVYVMTLCTRVSFLSPWLYCSKSRVVKITSIGYMRSERVYKVFCYIIVLLPFSMHPYLQLHIRI